MGFDHEKLIQLAEEKGWRIEKTGGGHRKLVSPDGATVYASGTPSDHRAGRNLARDLKAAGLDVRGEMDPVQRAGAMTTFIKDYMRSHPEKIHSTPDLFLVLRSQYPSAKEGNVSVMLSKWSKNGVIERVEKGAYRWLTDRPQGPIGRPKVRGLSSAVAEVMSQPPEPMPQAPDVDVDADLQALDAALAALGHIEAVVRKHRAVFAQLAKLKKILAE